MLYRVRLREEAARALLQAKTLAGVNVWTARSLPIRPGALPMIQVQVLADHAEPWGPSSPSFTRTAGLLVTAKVAFRTDANGLSSEGEQLLDTICEQIEQTLMLDVAFLQMIQKVSAIESELGFDSTAGDQIATARIRFDLEYVDTFVPNSVPLTDIRGTIVDQVSGDTLAVFDAPLSQTPLPGPPPGELLAPFGASPPFP